MKNYSTKALENQVKHTWLHISFTEDITEELGNSIPYPQHYYKKGDKFIYCWLIDGFFHTQNNVKFLNDIIARFKLTFPNSKHIKTTITNETNINPIKLKAFQGLKSKANEVIKEYKQLDSLIHKDSTFWVLKLYAEELIRQDGMIIYQRLEKFALENFGNHKKGWSTIRMKIASIYNWYFDKDWQIGREKKKSKEEVMATRIENIQKVNRDREENTRQKIKNAISGLLADTMFRKKNKTWNAKAIAEYLKIDARTVRKHLKEIDL